MNRKKQTDQADAVIRVTLPRDDLEAGRRVAGQAIKDAIAAAEDVNATRKGKSRVSSSAFELTLLDAAGNRMFSLSKPGGRQMFFSDLEKRRDRLLPNFSYLVVSDPQGRRIVVRIEFEGSTLQ